MRQFFLINFFLKKKLVHKDCNTCLCCLLVSYLLWQVYWRRRWRLNSRFNTVTVPLCQTPLQNSIQRNSSSTFLLQQSLFYPMWLQHRHRVARSNNSNKEECKNILRGFKLKRSCRKCLELHRKCYVKLLPLLFVLKNNQTISCKQLCTVIWKWWWCKGF